MALVPVDRSRVAWGAIGAILGGAMAFVVYSFVGTVVFALFIYYATRPVYRRLRRRVGNRTITAALSLGALALPLVLLLAYALAIGLQEFERASESYRLPFESAVAPYVDVSAAAREPGALLADPSVVEAAAGAADTVLGYLGFVGTGLLHLFVMFAIAFYLLRDGPRLSRWVVRQFGDGAGVLEAYGRAVDTDFASIFAGNILNAIATGALGAIVYSSLNFVAPAGGGVPYPALIGLLAGAASLVPVVGMKLVYGPVVGYLLFVEASAADPVYWFPVTFALLSFVVVDTIPDLLLRPYVSGRNLHVGLVMFAYIFGPLLFGWYGIFLGPILLVLTIHFARRVLPELVSGTQIRPFAVDPGAIPSPGEPNDDGESEPGAEPTGPVDVETGAGTEPGPVDG
jgi:predicted PurR-regulated permease PerM